jgi:isopropylmalate/homocitrate/citramalate synthase
MGAMSGRASQLVYDWNSVDCPPRVGAGLVVFDDETLRDGLQSPSARHPSHEEKLAFLRLAASCGITSADVGLPGAGERAAREVEELCREVVAEGLALAPNCAARTSDDDIKAVLGVIQRLGSSLEVMLFLAFSPLRRGIEGWRLEELLVRVERTVGAAVAGGACVTFVAEDASRTHPDDLRELYLAAVRAGAARVCVADTAGHVTPLGAYQVVAHVRGVLNGHDFATIELDWHGHNDRGLAVANALSAAMAGAQRLHGTALGVGERVGNPPMEQLLVNARLLGWASPQLDRLMAYAECAGAMLGVTVPPWAPVVGRDAFRTTTGVHASALLKAGRKGEDEIVDLVYSAVPAAWLGRRQEIEVGPMSGSSNIRAWLAGHGYDTEAKLVAEILAVAKNSKRTLTDEEIEAIVSKVLRGGA